MNLYVEQSLNAMVGEAVSAREVIARAAELGLPVIVGCSIVDVGVNPHQLDC